MRRTKHQITLLILVAASSLLHVRVLSGTTRSSFWSDAFQFVGPAAPKGIFFDSTPSSSAAKHQKTKSARAVTLIRRNLFPDSLLQDNNNNNNNNKQQQQQAPPSGSVLGASLLFAGTAIGAGMLALPAETAPAGYIPSLTSLALCWFFTYVTSIITLEASWTVSGGFNHDPDQAEAGFLSVAKTTLGPVGEIVTAAFFWFLLTSIVVAYTSEGGELVSQFFLAVAGGEQQQQQQQVATLVSPTIGSVMFMLFFATLAIFGTEKVDLVNRILVVGLLGSFFGLLGVGIPQIDTSLLLSRTDWATVYPQVISIGILAFGAQNVVPTLLQYLGGDAVRTQRAILLGSLIPLVMYCLWESVFFGIVPWDPNAVDNKMQVVTALGTTGGTSVQELVEVFSACAIGSSMAGASVSLVDFFQDFLTTHKAHLAASSTGRFLAAALALGPALGLACAFPGAFLSVLENAGLIGGVTLYGLIPALAVIRLRNDVNLTSAGGLDMPTRLPGGILVLHLLLTASCALLLPDAVELGQKVLLER